MHSRGVTQTVFYNILDPNFQAIHLAVHPKHNQTFMYILCKQSGGAKEVKVSKKLSCAFLCSHPEHTLHAYVHTHM